MRDLLLRAFVVFGVVVAALTELLSPFHLLRRLPLAAAWLLIAVAAAVFLYRHPPPLKRFRIRPWETAIAAVIAAIGAAVTLAAGLSAPNTYDALAYHLPRVVYWAQSGSVAFFPTSYFTQISLPPLAEYIMLHTYVLSGGDRLVNLVGTVAFVGCILGVSAVALAFRAGSKAQALAALFCATLPNAILQASGAKNDSLLALWLVAMVYFAARRDAPFLGLSFGLALATKSTAYLFAPPLAAAVLLAGAVEGHRPRWRAILPWLVGGVLLLNAPQYLRNLTFSGSPLGPDSPYETDPVRWANDHPGWKSTVSNALRNLSDQLGDRSERWNQAVYRGTIGIHGILGIDPNDPANTWNRTNFTPPANTAHEGSANNRWHLVLLCAAMGLAAWRAWKRREFRWLIHGGGLFAAYLLFCFYVKWEPSGARFQLPLFVLGSPLAGFLLAQIRPAMVTVLLSLFLVGNARLPALKNWTRPLMGAYNLFQTPRDATYFLDMLPLHNSESYRRAADLTAQSRCSMVGIDATRDQAEYPFQALLRERNPAVRFLHTGVENSSARYYATWSGLHACAVLCIDCAGDGRKVALYQSVGQPIPLGRFLLFLAR